MNASRFMQEASCDVAPRGRANLPLCARLHAEQARSIAMADPERAAAATDWLMVYAETFTRAIG